jgi:hypothetical protein
VDGIIGQDDLGRLNLHTGCNHKVRKLGHRPQTALSDTSKPETGETIRPYLIRRAVERKRQFFLVGDDTRRECETHMPCRLTKRADHIRNDRSIKRQLHRLHRHDRRRGLNLNVMHRRGMMDHFEPFTLAAAAVSAAQGETGEAVSGSKASEPTWQTIGRPNDCKHIDRGIYRSGKPTRRRTANDLPRKVTDPTTRHTLTGPMDSPPISL